MPNAAEHIKRKLPSMYHQFKQLADIDITKEPMEVGPTTHYVMGGIRVDAETQMSRIAGLFAAGECAAGINGANRLGGNSLSDLLVLGKRAGEFAARFAGEHGPGQVHDDQLDAAERYALEPFERSDHADAEGPFSVQHDLQDVMQESRGHRPNGGRDAAGAQRGPQPARARRACRRARESRVQRRVADRAGLGESAHGVRGRDASRDRADRKPRRTFPQ